jgi:hypothetical protein
VLIPAAVAVFGLTVQSVGLVLATVLITLLGSYATPLARLREALMTAAVLAFLAVAVFVWGIGLLIPIWPEF